MRYVQILLFSLPIGAATPMTAPAGTAVTVTLQPCSAQKLHGTVKLNLKGADADRVLTASLTLANHASLGKAEVMPNSLKSGNTATVEVQIEIEDCTAPSTGTLILNPETDGLVYTVTFRLEPQHISASDGAYWASLAFRGPLVLAILIAIVAAAMVKDKLTNRMGSATWDFTSSWAANVTFGGGLLTGVLGFTLFPDNGHFFSKAGYLAASVVFPVIAMLAPQTYNIFRRPVDTGNPNGLPQLQGFVISFVIAASIAAWAATAQAAITALAIAEIYYSGYLAGALAWPAIVLLVLLCFGLGVYVVSTVVFTVNHQAQHAVTAMAAMQLPGDVPMPDWRVL
jgi:hypothetical protein